MKELTSKGPSSTENDAKKMRSFKGLENCLHQAHLCEEENLVEDGQPDRKEATTGEGKEDDEGLNTTGVHCKHQWKQHKGAHSTISICPLKKGKTR